MSEKVKAAAAKVRIARQQEDVTFQKVIDAPINSEEWRNASGVHDTACKATARAERTLVNLLMLELYGKTGY